MWSEDVSKNKMLVVWFIKTIKKFFFKILQDRDLSNTLDNTLTFNWYSSWFSINSRTFPLNLQTYIIRFYMCVSWFVKSNDIDFTGNSQIDYVPIHIHLKETHYKKVIYRKILQLYLSMCLPFQILAQKYLWCQFHLLIRQNTSIFTHLYNNIYMSVIYHIIWEQYTRQNALAVIHKFRRKGTTWLKTKVDCGVWLWNTSCKVFF